MACNVYQSRSFLGRLSWMPLNRLDFSASDTESRCVLEMTLVSSGLFIFFFVIAEQFTDPFLHLFSARSASCSLFFSRQQRHWMAQGRGRVNNIPFCLDGGAIGSWWFRSPTAPTLFSLCAGIRRSLTTATGATQEAERPDDRLCDTIHRFFHFWLMVQAAVTTLSLIAMTTMFAYHFLSSAIPFTVCPSGRLGETKLLATNLQPQFIIETFNVVGGCSLTAFRFATLPCVFGSRNAVGEVFLSGNEQIFVFVKNIDYHSARSGLQESNRLVFLWSLDQKWPQAFLVCGERDFRDIIYTTLPPPWNRGHGQVQGRTSHNPILLAANRRSGGRGVPAWWRCWSECMKH